MDSFRIRAAVVDIEGRRTYPAEVTVEQGHITSIAPCEDPVEGFLLPGFIDAHVHVESSMLVPAEFARLAVTHGTVATVSDPHEIANVLGMAGVDYMIENGRQVPFHFFFGAPSCVPATRFETAGAVLDAVAVGALLERPEVRYLSEVMNFPGVLAQDPELMAKIAHARRLGKAIDGHAPGLRGEEAARYIRAGVPDGPVVISTDHECFTLEEALDKIAAGMHISIREGSAARNMDALMPLIDSHPQQVMLCCDDTHPDSLVAGHIDRLCAKAVAAGCDVYNVLQAACINPIQHYRLPVGRLRVGDPADLILVEDLQHFRVQHTWVQGKLVAEGGRTLIPRHPSASPNHFACRARSEDEFAVPAGEGPLHVIQALDGQLITPHVQMEPLEQAGFCIPDTERDLLKIAVVNRYQHAPVAVGWIHGIGLKRGALASCVAHDSHNIVAVGTSDRELCQAVNRVIAEQGGISVCDGEHVSSLPLPVAGIMTTADAYDVADAYAALDRAAKALGSPLRAPFMTLSFMALLVIPHLKMSDLGLFDGDLGRLISGPDRSH
jgi:adenine deaminase